MRKAILLCIGFLLAHLIQAGSLEEKLPKCNINALSMYMAWYVYAEDLTAHVGYQFKQSSEGNRLENCGEWNVAATYGRNFSHGVVVTNEKRKVGIVAFRGTTSVWNDWKINFKTSLVPCEYIPGVDCGNVHSGFHSSYMLMQKDTEAHMIQLLHDGYDVIVTGHSKGAAFAILSTLSLTHSVKDAYRSNIHNIGFASPLVGDDKFVEAYDLAVINTAQYMARFRGKMLTELDLVTRIPPKMLGYSRTKNGWYVGCNPLYIGNPNTIHALPPSPSAFMRYMPRAVGCHSQQCYLDGVITEKIDVANDFDMVGAEFGEVEPAQFEEDMQTIMKFVSKHERGSKEVHSLEEINKCMHACERYLKYGSSDDGSCTAMCN